MNNRENLKSQLDKLHIFRFKERYKVIIKIMCIQIFLDDDKSFKIEHENIIRKMYPIVEYHLIYSVKNELGERIKKTIIEEIRIN